MFPYTNFVRGFKQPGALNWLAQKASSLPSWVNPFGTTQTEAKWKEAPEGETIGIVSYNAFAKKHFGKKFKYVHKSG